MVEATDSPVVSRLFTKGRHRNASVILLLQNMFPKGKYNTDISRNAQYLALFRSPSDRKQIGIIGERMFDKNRVHFMNAYYKETEKPFEYFSPGGEGGYRHPRREFMTVRDFDQLGGADFKNRCYTGQYRGL